MSRTRAMQNCYGKPSKLFIVDGKKNCEKCILYSEEETAHGGPVAMVMYALGISVLQSELKHGNKCQKYCVCR